MILSPFSILNKEFPWKMEEKGENLPQLHHIGLIQQPEDHLCCPSALHIDPGSYKLGLELRSVRRGGAVN